MLKTACQWSNQQARLPALHAEPIAPLIDREDLVAELIEAAYGFVSRHGFKGTFIEVELGLRDALRACQGRIQESASDPAPTGTPRSAPSRSATNTTGDQR
jgi:hypothetical protein